MKLLKNVSTSIRAQNKCADLTALALPARRTENPAARRPRIGLLRGPPIPMLLFRALQRHASLPFSVFFLTFLHSLPLGGYPEPHDFRRPPLEPISPSAIRGQTTPPPNEPPPLTVP